MEWYRMASGEAVFGEIAARPPGARVVELMNYSCDADLYVAWAEAVLNGRLRAPITQKFNSGNVFKRAHGAGHISAVEGLDELLQRYGEHVVNIDLLPVGAPRRDWRTTTVGDGGVVVRHHELAKVLEMTDAFARDLTLYAG
jgi:hypothetical protein